MTSNEIELPADVADLLNGNELAAKAGETFMLMTVDPTGWPHCALLSPGEVLAEDARTVAIVLHEETGTSAALMSTSRALLVVVTGGRAVRIRLEVKQDAVGVVNGDPSALFRTSVQDVEGDQVSYARIVHGIRYELPNEDATVAAWERKVAALREYCTNA